MVTEWFVGAVMGAVTWLLETVPFPDVPSWFDSVSSGLSTLGSAVSAAGYWIPVPLLASIIVAYLGFHLFAVVVKLARQVLSYVSLGGGLS